MEVRTIKKNNLFLTVILIFNLYACQHAMCQAAIKEKLEGTWKFDMAKTIRYRINNGVPWHVKNKYKMGEATGNLILSDNQYRYLKEGSGEIIDEGEFKLIKVNNNNVIRFYPADNRFSVNGKDIQGILKGFTTMTGDKLPFLTGFRFVNENETQSFSIVRGFEEKITIKDDNAFWKRIKKEK